MKPLFLIIITGIIAYFLMKKKLTKVYDARFIEWVRWMLIVPIIQVLIFLPLGFIASQAPKIVTEFEKLGNISTWSPLLGEDINNLVKFAVENNIISDNVAPIPNMEKLETISHITQVIGIFGIIVFLIMMLIQIRGIFGQEEEKRVKLANSLASGVIVFVGMQIAWMITNIMESIGMSDGNDISNFVFMFILTFSLIPLSNKFRGAISLYYPQKEARDMRIYKNEPKYMPSPTLNNKNISKTEQLKELKQLLDQGFLTQEEFDTEKQKILNS